MKNQKEILKKCFTDVIWMAIRYANGRQTYAPSMIRSAIKNFQEVFPDWKPRKDITLENFFDIPWKLEFRGDFLNDLVEGEENE